MCHLTDVTQSYDVSMAIFRKFLTINDKSLKIANWFFSKFISAVKLPYKEQYHVHYNFTYKRDHKLATVQSFVRKKSKTQIK